MTWTEKVIADVGRVREGPAEGFPNTPGLRGLFAPSERRPRMRAAGRDSAPGPFLSVIGEDQRERRTDTHNPPLRMICSIEATDGLRRSSGTGWLVGRRIVVTAAHVLHDAGNGFQATSAIVRPGREVGSEPFGTYAVDARCWRLHPGYQGDGPPGADMALLRLDRPVAPDPSFFGVAALTAAATLDRMVTIAGYPGYVGNAAQDEPNRIPEDERFLRLYAHRDRILRIDDDQLFYDVDTMPGQSGAPVLLMPLATDAFSGPTVIGIHTRGRDEQATDAEERAHNTATRITPAMLDMMRDFVGEFDA